MRSRDFVEERYEGLLDLPVEFVRAARRSGAVDSARSRSSPRRSHSWTTPPSTGCYTAYSRADRLAGRSEEAAAQLDPGLLGEQTEVDLAGEVGRLGPEIQARSSGGHPGALTAAAELGEPVDRFFEDILVMADDSAVRANRLRLLLDVRDALGLLGDFGQIPR